MANYEFVARNHYKPLTFEEMLIPWLYYKEASDKAKEEYSTYSDKAGIFKYLSTTLPEDSAARKLYEKYANDLENSARAFQEHGFRGSIASDLFNLRRRYSGEIGELERAEKRRQADWELNSQKLLKDPSMIFRNQKPSIDDYLFGQSPNNYAVSGDTLYAKGAAAGASMSSGIVTTKEGPKVLGDYYIEYFTRRGYTKESMDAFRRDISKIPELKTAALNILKANGALDNLSGKELDSALQQTVNGLADGAAAKIDVQLKDNKGKLTAAEAANVKLKEEQLEIDRRKAALDEAKFELEKQKFEFEKTKEGTKTEGSKDEDSGDAGVQLLDGTRRNVLTEKEVGNKKNMLNNWFKYQDYFIRDEQGNWHMKPSARKKYLNRMPVGLGYSNLNAGFQKFVDDLGLGDMASGKISQKGGILDKFINDVTGIYDETKSTEYTKEINHTNYADVKGKLMSLSSDGKIQNYSLSKEDAGAYSLQPSDRIDVKNLLDGDVQSAQVVVGKHAQYMEVKLGDKGHTTIRIPMENWNESMSKMVRGGLGALDALDNLLIEKGLDPADPGNVLTLPDGTQISVATQKNKIINTMLRNASSALATTQVAPFKLDPGINLTK